jgi:Zn-dependent protease with chaperone function
MSGDMPQPTTDAGHGGTVEPINAADTSLRLRMVVAAAFITIYYLFVLGLLDAIVGALGGYYNIGLLTGTPGLIVSALLTAGVAGLMYYRGRRRHLDDATVTELDAEEAPDAHEDINWLSRRLKIETPSLYERDAARPNAYATGRRSDGDIVVSSGLRETLDREELTAVLAHEAAHLRNRDSVVMVLADSVRRMFASVFYVSAGIMAGFWIMMRNSELAPIDSFRLAWRRFNRGLSGVAIAAIAGLAASLVLLFSRALSRYREYVADATAAQAMNDPEPMQRALQTIEQAHENDGSPDRDEAAVPSSLQIRGNVRGTLAGLFSTHPSTENRIDRLSRFRDR